MKKTLAALLLLSLVVGCGSETQEGLKENANTRSANDQDAPREKTVVLIDFDKSETAFSFKGGGLLKLNTEEDLVQVDLLLDLPLGLASNNSELDDNFTGRGGIIDLGKTAMRDIKKIPLYGYQFDLSPEKIRPGHTYCVRTAGGEQYGLFHVVKLDPKAATLEISWRYPAGKPVVNVAGNLTKQDVAAIAAQPHEPIKDTPQLISALLKPGIWERTGKVEIKKTPEQPARTIERRFIKTVRHAHGKYVVIETTDTDGATRGWEVQCYDPLAKKMYSTTVSAQGPRFLFTGRPDPSTRSAQWKRVPTKDDSRSIVLTITCDRDGLGAHIEARAHRDGNLVTTTTAKLKRIGDLPGSTRQIDLEPPSEREFVRDQAEMLDAEAITQIKEIADQLLTETATPIVVVTIESMASCGVGDIGIETFATLLFNQWGIGAAEIDGEQRNTGILLLVSKGDHKVRIELGQDWGRQKDDLCKQIMDEQIISHFKQKKFSQGILSGVKALERMARDQPLPTNDGAGKKNGGVFSALFRAVSKSIPEVEAAESVDPKPPENQ